MEIILKFEGREDTARLCGNGFRVSFHSFNSVTLKEGLFSDDWLGLFSGPKYVVVN